MTSGSKLDKEVFQEYFHKRDKLRAIASEIRNIAESPEIKQKIYSIEEDEQTRNDTVMEGQVLYKLHKVRERDYSIIIKKKEQAFHLFGKLACEACVFVFDEFYGLIGRGFIECHHRIPLSSIKVSTKTTLDDLSLVCANCHCMLHKEIDVLSVEDLKLKIKYRRC